MWFKNHNFLNAAVTDAIKKKNNKICGCFASGSFYSFTSLSLMLQSHAEFFHFHSPNELVRRIPARRRIQVSEGGGKQTARRCRECLWCNFCPHPPPHQLKSRICYAPSCTDRGRKHETVTFFFIAGGKTCRNNSFCSFQRHSSAVSPLRKKRGK